LVADGGGDTSKLRETRKAIKIGSCITKLNYNINYTILVIIIPPMSNEIKCSVCQIKSNDGNEFSRIAKSGISGTCKKCQCKATIECRLRIIEKRKNNEIPTEPTITEKQCCKCKEIKLVADFPKDIGKILGIADKCKKCNCEKVQIRRLKIVSGEIERTDAPSQKQCVQCKIIKNITEFRKDIGTITGYGYKCLICTCLDTQLFQKKPENIIKIKERKKAYRLRPDVKGRVDLRGSISSRIATHIKQQGGQGPKKQHSIDYLGCTIDFLIKWLEFQFDEDMTWENRASWHIDHVIPCAAFDSNNEVHLGLCYHWTNVQPLIKHDNMSKSDKLEQKYFDKVVERVIKFNLINQEFMGYQALLEMIKWLQVECRYGKNALDTREHENVLLKSAIRSEAPNPVMTMGTENVQRIDGGGS